SPSRHHHEERLALWRIGRKDSHTASSKDFRLERTAVAHKRTAKPVVPAAQPPPPPIPPVPLQPPPAPISANSTAPPPPAVTTHGAVPVPPAPPRPVPSPPETPPQPAPRPVEDLWNSAAQRQRRNQAGKRR